MSTQNRFSADDVNAAVNRAAREMTDFTASPNLRDRVMAQIEERPRANWLWRFAIAGGTISAAALAVVVLWRAPQTVSAPQPIALAERVAPEPSGEFVAAAAKANPTAADIASSPAVSMKSIQRVSQWRVVIEESAAERDWRARGIAALETPEALTVQPLNADRTVIAPIDIAPLGVAPIRITAQGDDGINR